MFVPFGELMPIEDRVHHIGELAETFGVSLRTIRFYEESGLIKPRRVSTRTRVYDRDDVARLSLIVALRRYGLAVDAIRDLLSVRDRKSSTDFRAALAAALDARREAMDREIAEIATLRDDLGKWIKEFTVR